MLTQITQVLESVISKNGGYTFAVIGGRERDGGELAGTRNTITLLL